MTLKFYYGSGSPFAWKVWLALVFKGIPHEFERIMFDAASLKSESFLKINPRGKVPAITDGDYSLFESSAIVEYLEDSYSNRPVIGTDAASRAHNRRLAAEADSYLYPLQREIFSQTLFKGPDKPRDLDAIAKANEAAVAELQRWSAYLGTHQFFGGELPMVSDFAAFPILRAFVRVEEREAAHGLGDRMPANIRAYIARMEALPEVQKTYPPHWKS